MLRPGTVLNGRYRILKPLGAGGMGQVFAVCDEGTQSATPKVLKISRELYADIANYVQREAQILQQSYHPGIPRMAADDGYFCEYLKDKGEWVHCLVMEKIPGTNLLEWLFHDDHWVTEEQAINWLKQLVDILAYLHQRSIFHRDIKPSNIMLRPDGQLVLIDFGIARTLNTTFHAKQKRDRTGTRMGSDGYAPPEQADGRAVPQSDFFALGRTMMHLLTKTHPTDLPPGSCREQLEACDRPTPISSNCIQLLDTLTKLSPGDRPQTPQAIFRAIARLERDRHPTHRWQELPWIVLWSMGVTAFCILLRSLGWLQPAELAAFDLLMRLRPPEPPDPRILLITIDAQDKDWQWEQGMDIQADGQSLSDAALDQLFAKLERYEPRVIGLDLYRDFAVSPEYAHLVDTLGSDRIITICKAGSQQEQPSIPPPDGARWVGFSDFSADMDAVLRRQILAIKAPSGSTCPEASLALSAHLVFRYLYDDGIIATFDEQGLMVGDRLFSYLKVPFGGYQRLNDGGEQLMLNYRASRSPLDVAHHISLRDFLTTDVDPSLIQDAIVLVGRIGSDSGDRHQTPLGTMPGVVIHAHHTSQVISAVFDQRPVIWVWRLPFEKGWIILWAFLSGTSVWIISKIRFLILAEIIIISFIISCCFAFMMAGGWIPLIPPLLTSLGSVIGIATGRYVLIRVVTAQTVVSPPKDSLIHTRRCL